MDAVHDEQLMAGLRAAGARITAAGSLIEARSTMACIERCAEVLRDAGLYPVFMTAVHTDPSFILDYRFAAWHSSCRVMLSSPAGDGGRAVSLTPLFPGLQWHEREARDMFGIAFDNHPDLRPLLLPDEDRDLHPLRKDAQRLKTPAQLGCADYPAPGGHAS